MNGAKILCVAAASVFIATNNIKKEAPKKGTYLYQPERIRVVIRAPDVPVERRRGGGEQCAILRFAGDGKVAPRRL